MLSRKVDKLLLNWVNDSISQRDIDVLLEVSLHSSIGLRSNLLKKIPEIEKKVYFQANFNKSFSEFEYVRKDNLLKMKEGTSVLNALNIELLTLKYLF